jgi:hypothetical protein
MHLRGHDSNHDRPLKTVLEWVPEASSMPPRRPVGAALETKRLGNGVVQRAVIGVLAAADRALTVADVVLSLIVRGGTEDELRRPRLQGQQLDLYASCP